MDVKGGILWILPLPFHRKEQAVVVKVLPIPIWGLDSELDSYAKTAAASAHPIVEVFQDRRALASRPMALAK